MEIFPAGQTGSAPRSIRIQQCHRYSRDLGRTSRNRARGVVPSSDTLVYAGVPRRLHSGSRRHATGVKPEPRPSPRARRGARRRRRDQALSGASAQLAVRRGSHDVPSYRATVSMGVRFVPRPLRPAGFETVPRPPLTRIPPRGRGSATTRQLDVEDASSPTWPPSPPAGSWRAPPRSCWTRPETSWRRPWV